MTRDGNVDGSSLQQAFSVDWIRQPETVVITDTFLRLFFRVEVSLLSKVDR